MIEVGYLREREKVKSLPKEVQEAIQRILQILDTEYGADRNKYEDDGGYVLVVEEEKDFEEIKDKTYIHCADDIAEYVDSKRQIKPLIFIIFAKNLIQEILYFQFIESTHKYFIYSKEGEPLEEVVSFFHIL